MNISVAIIGLGYVGLPLAIEFSKKYKTIGFDINDKRIRELNNKIDKTNEISKEELKNTKAIFTSNICDIKNSNFYVITVPTPIDENKKPDLTPLIMASRFVAYNLKKGNIVVYESTVAPGTTEDVCIPILEKLSKLRACSDFKVGYSPERINPGDKVNTLKSIVKVVSAKDKKSLEIISEVYQNILDVPVYRASSIKVAEASKMLENVQRDVNIALMNEFSLFLQKMDINTNDVLNACYTKWNFSKYKPGLVGGHCVGVDPYYLIEKANDLDHNLPLIETARKINSEMKEYILKKCKNFLLTKNLSFKEAEIAIFGLTFKEDCPDTRNSMAFEIAESIHCKKVYRIDPYVILDKQEIGKSDIVIFAVTHKEFKQMTKEKVMSYLKPNSMIIDIGGMFNKWAFGKDIKYFCL